MKLIVPATLLAILLIHPGAFAQWHGPDTPDSLSFQGRLADATGTPVANGNYSIRFRMYKGSAQIWEQTHASVPIDSGVFNVILSGTVTWPLDTVAFNEAIDLGIKVGANAEMVPRSPLTSAAYSLGMRGMYAVEAVDGNGSEGTNLVGGASNNLVAAGVAGATIGGGGGIDFEDNPQGNTVSGSWGTVGGGSGNDASGVASTIGGGTGNSAGDDYATVSGGRFNNAAGDDAVIGGGRSNDATGSKAVIGGGSFNDATGQISTIGGGSHNETAGLYATIPGGWQNKALKGHTFAAGQRAEANHSGTFVWADSASNVGVPFQSTGLNQFLIRAGGGVGIGTNSPNQEVTILDTGGDGDALLNLKATSPAAREMLIGVNQSFGGFVSVETNNSLGFRTNGTTWVVIDPAGDTRFEGDAYPRYSNQFSLGRSGSEWSEVWATNGAIQNSDRRLKQAIAPLRYGLDDVMRLEPVSYEWRAHPEQGTKLGLIAQEVADVIPEVISGSEAESEYLGMNYAELVPVLVKAIQEQQAHIASQDERIAELERRMMP